MKSFSFLLFLIFLSLNSFALANYSDDLPIEDIPRPGSFDETLELIDRAIEQNRARMERISSRRIEEFQSDFKEGHYVELITEGSVLFQKRMDLIANAEKSIFISAYHIGYDVSARLVIDSLCAASQRGIDVRIIGDAHGSKSFYKKFSDQLRNECGVGVLNYNPPAWGLSKLAYVLHEKLFIVDGKTVIMGGHGYKNSYHGFPGVRKYFHDSDAYIEGPVACYYHKKFIQNFEESREWDMPKGLLGSRLRSQEEDNALFGSQVYAPCEEVVSQRGNVRVNPNYANPLFQEDRPIYESHVNAFLSTQKTIKIYAPYFVPHDRAVAAFLWARAKGIEVDVITNSVTSNDEKTTLLSAMVYRVQKLLDAGVRIHLFRGPSTMHRKAGIYDSKLAHIGSDNYDSRGFAYSSESVSYIDDQNFARELEQKFDEDIKHSDPLNQERMQEIVEETGQFTYWFIRNGLWELY